MSAYTGIGYDVVWCKHLGHDISEHSWNYLLLRRFHTLDILIAVARVAQRRQKVI